MSDRVSLLAHAIRRVPFTLLMLTALLIVQLIANPGFGALPHKWIVRWGYAPHDLEKLRWWTLFTSVLFIDNARSFAQALLMIGLVGAAVEWVAGTWRTALTFWGVHVAAVLGESLLFVAPLYYGAGTTFGERMFDTHDVGASAGYYGVAGLACAMLPKPWRYVAAALVFGFLLSNFFWPTPVSGDTPLRWVANLAHVIAFPLGYTAYHWHARAEARSLTGESHAR